MYQALVFLHVLSVLIFFLAHGATAIVMFRLRQERHPERMRALLAVRQAAVPAFGISGSAMSLSGIALGFMGSWWRTGWLWTSIGLLIAVSVVMAVFGRQYLDRISAALAPESKTNSPAELEAATVGGRPVLLTVIGVAVLSAILWLMMFKPF